MTERTILIWGAGRIGRGFVADLFHAAGYRLVLVDESAELIDQLRAAGRYTIVRAESSERRQDVVIAGYRALATAQTEELAEAIARADIVAVAVFPQHFPQVAQQLAPGILRRQAERPNVSLDIILCTNLAHAGPQFRALLHEALLPEPGPHLLTPGLRRRPLRSPQARGEGVREYLEARVGVVETLVIRIVSDPPAHLSEREPLLVWTNGYPELAVDRHAFKGDIPPVSGLRLVDDMRAEETRKLYTYNMVQAALAYWGARRGYHLVVECLADPALRSEAEGALDEVSQALQAEYGFRAAEMARWIEDALAQTNNPALGDTLKRLGADPRRKLKREDRLIGPALLARKHGIQPRCLVRAIAAGLTYDDPGDAGATHVQQQISALGLPAAVREVCGLTEAEADLIEAIVGAYHHLSSE